VHQHNMIDQVASRPNAGGILPDVAVNANCWMWKNSDANPRA
jgi:hypothetical protein